MPQSSDSLIWIDAHHHLWDLNKVHYPWLMAKGEMRFFGQPDPIRKNYLVDDFSADHGQQISKSVHIQVGCAAQDQFNETAFVQSMAEQKPGLPSAAVVAINMQQADITECIEQHKQYSLVRGVRDIIGKSPEENKTLPVFQPKVWRNNLAALAQHQLSFDLQFTEEQYDIVYKTFAELPELKLVICHLASPWDQSQAGFTRWQKAMHQFAQLPNCYIKISGFAMFNHGFHADRFRRYAHSAIEIFGADKCMLGSNFPVDKLYMNYQQLFEHWRQLIAECTLSEALSLTSQTATEFYRL